MKKSHEFLNSLITPQWQCNETKNTENNSNEINFLLKIENEDIRTHC